MERVVRGGFFAVRRRKQSLSGSWRCVGTFSPADAVRVDRQREFFKRKWLEKIYGTKKEKTKIEAFEIPSGIHVQIDSRESTLSAHISAMIASSSSVSSAQLPEGDISISRGDRRILIERKTIEDFYNSLKSKRLFDQIGRIFESITKTSSSSKTIPVIILEGPLTPSALTSPALYNTVSSMYHSLILRDKLLVIRTDSIQDTARLILSFTKKFDSIFRQPNDFSSIVHVNSTGRQINGIHLPYIRMLMSIRGISANRAQSIASVFPSMDALADALKTPGGIARVAQLVAPSNSRAVGSPIGTATTFNIAEAVLGASNPIVSEFKLVKILVSSVGIPPSEAADIAKNFQSIQNLRLACLSRKTELAIPPPVEAFVSSTVDDPESLLVGLKGVKGVSACTAENLTNHFGTIRKLFEYVQTLKDENQIEMMIRLVGTSSKRAIAKTAVSNILTWLRSEGFLSPKKQLD